MACLARLEKSAPVLLKPFQQSMSFQKTQVATQSVVAQVRFSHEPCLSNARFRRFQDMDRNLQPAPILPSRFCQRTVKAK